MRYRALLLALIGCVAAAPAHAVTNTGAVLLTLPANARSIAMGDIGAADNSDPSTIFFNPANVCSVSRIYGLVSQQRFEIDHDIWLRRANVGFASRSEGKSPWTVGVDVGYGRLSYGTVAMVGNGGVDTLDTFEDVASVTAGIAFHASPSFELRFGGGVKMWRARFDQQYQATSFDAGLAMTMHERYGAWNITPSLAGAVIDVGEDIGYSENQSDPLPTRVNVGASLCVASSPCDVLWAKVPLLAVVMQAEAIKQVHDGVEWGLGNEIAIAQMLFLRTGVRRYSADNSEPAPTYASWGVGAGIPLGHLRMRFDYGRQATDYDRDHMDALVEWNF